MQILAGRWVRAFQFRHEGMSCLSKAWKFLKSCHGRQVLSSNVRHELVRLPSFRAHLRVPVGPVVMASRASLTGGAICR